MSFNLISSIVFLTIIAISAWIINKQNRKIRSRLKIVESNLESLTELTGQAVHILGIVDNTLHGKDETPLDYAVFLGEAEISQHATADEAKMASELATQRTGALHDWGLSKISRM